MLNLRNAKNITIIGGGTAGWFAALFLRKSFPSHVNVQLIESPKVGIVGVGEGGLVNLINALNHLNIPTSQFMSETGASYKWGFCYEGWRSGKRDDEFFHLFINPTLTPFKEEFSGYFPLISGHIASGIPLACAVKDLDAIQNRYAFEQATEILTNQPSISTSMHFDSFKVSEFLKKIAKERGVIHTQTLVQDFELNEQGNVVKIISEDGEFPTDLVIDASGFARVLIGKKFKSKWQSFSEYLWLDQAIPFHLNHHGKNPELVTRATAMNSGWMWQIPLKERIGAGYVFSSEFITEQQVIDEIQQYFGEEIEPQKTIKFEPGYFEEVWQNNVMALGLASGFVEPLEATSIGQMLEQIRMFIKVIQRSGAIVSDTVIKQFNEANAQSWLGIRDFLRMHYDTPRRDTPFWQKVAETPYPESYANLKEVMMQRMPRMQDIEGYATFGWNGIFHVVNWIFVAQALGLISPEACRNELSMLSKSDQENIMRYINQFKPRMS